MGEDFIWPKQHSWQILHAGECIFNLTDKNSERKLKMKKNHFAFNRTAVVISGSTCIVLLFLLFFLGISNIKLTLKRFLSSAPSVCLVKWRAAHAGLTSTCLWMACSPFAAGASTLLISIVLGLALCAVPVSYIMINTQTECFYLLIECLMCLCASFIQLQRH